MSGDGRSIRSLCVVGGTIAGFSAALAFARALPKVPVRLIATPADPNALTDRMAIALPVIHRFHAAIGISELDLVRDGIAVHHLGTRFEHWSGSGEPWLHVFGEYGLAAAGVPFHQIWARLRATGQAERFDRYSAAASLAEAGKFVHPQDDPRSPLSTYLYGLRLDPAAYRGRLAAEAVTLGIEIVAGSLAGAERRDDGGVEAIRLADGRAVEADLFLDCAGPSAPLRSLLDHGFEDWSGWLPCDRFGIALLPPAAPLPSDRIAAIADGWSWTSTLPTGVANGLAWNSALLREQQAIERLAAEQQVEPAGTMTLRLGCRPEPWKHNVLALGESAVAVEPIQGAGFHLAQSAILRALELLPGRDCHPLELREYNRRTAQEAARVRDFQALHYQRSGRREGEFWKSAANSAPPDSLAHTLEQFEARGRLPFHEEESFEPQSWLAVLAGLGVLPGCHDPASDRIDPDQAAGSMADLAARLVALPARLPAYPDYLSRMAEKSSR